jgi:hypothetical protein
MVWYGRERGREGKGKGGEGGSTTFRNSTGSRKDLNVHLETFIVYNLHIFFFSLLPLPLLFSSLLFSYFPPILL